jgi:predicted DNA-binding transcriptional regulator YafY
MRCNTLDNASSNKLKLLYILKIFLEETDEDHQITMPELIEKLKHYEVKAERKSVSRDLDVLRDFGYEISDFEEMKGYYLIDREFELSELRFLIDAVLSSRCITTKKSKELIRKLEKQTSNHIAKKLRMNRTIDDRIKCKNEEFYYNIDKISRAINENRKITFQYYTYNLDKTRVLKRDGHVYTLSPYDLVWNEDYYYLIGAHDKYEDLTHYRIDRMHDINLVDEARRNSSELKDYDKGSTTSSYLKKTFKMFGGDACRVEVKFTNDMINPIIDRFGEEVIIVPLDEDHFKLMAEVNAGEGFISWILQLGEKAEILYPESLREEIKEKIELMRGLYK